ncbi:FAD binding domain-containing protein [Amylostereum chailletii]|nr:FAD binding domain-containing protein [Amylostereum chailletii]
MAASTLARYGKGKLKIRIVDKRSTKIFTGQADGLNPRMLEILQALDIAPDLLREANQLVEICFWTSVGEGKLARVGRVPTSLPGLSRFTESTIHQGRIESAFLDKIALWSKGEDERPRMKVERAVLPDRLVLPPMDSSALSDDPKDRIIVRLRHLSADEAKPAQFLPNVADGLFRSNVFGDDETHPGAQGLPSEEELEEVRTRYVLGCDGARSWVRGALGFRLEGDSANFFWGVIDGLPLTDFPDTRVRANVNSAEHGSAVIIPREHGIVRFYIQLPQPPAGQRPNRADVTPEKLLESLNRIMAPYTVDIPEVIWFTCYEVGQRLADPWVWNDRIFCVGDACHTHSPKAGQGMNVSMADAFNLSWKLAHVLQGKANSAILRTYYTERSAIARQLLEMDHKLSRLNSGRPKKDIFDKTGVSLVEFRQLIVKSSEFTSGVSVDYDDGIIVCKRAEVIEHAKHLARNLPTGPRLKSHQVVCLASAKPVHIGDLLPADGRWRIVIFPGDIRVPKLRGQLDDLCVFLEQDRASPVVKFTPKEEDPDAVIECLAILGGCPRSAIEPDAFGDVLRPRKGKYGYRDHNKIFVDDESYHHGHGHAYQQYGVDTQAGCVVVVRPDQYVALVTDVDDHARLGEIFAFQEVQQKANVALPTS